MKQEITRKDGIVYERTKRAAKYTSTYQIRVDKDFLNKIKRIAEIKGVGHNTLSREILESYIEEFEKKNGK